MIGPNWYDHTLATWKYEGVSFVVELPIKDSKPVEPPHA